MCEGEFKVTIKARENKTKQKQNNTKDVLKNLKWRHFIFYYFHSCYALVKIMTKIKRLEKYISYCTRRYTLIHTYKNHFYDIVEKKLRGNTTLPIKNGTLKMSKQLTSCKTIPMQSTLMSTSTSRLNEDHFSTLST